MENFKEKLKKMNSEQIPRETIINMMLYMTILIMPLIVVRTSSHRYILGKTMFLYVVEIFLIINIIRNGKFKIRKEHIIAGIFITTIFIVCLLSPYRLLSFIGTSARGEGFMAIFTYVTLFLASSVYLKVTSNSIDLILGVGSIHALYGILQFFHIDPVQEWALGGIGMDDSIGFLGNRMYFSAYIILFLVLSTYMFIFKGKKKYFISTMILFLCLLCTLTRSGWLSYGITLIIGLLFIIKRKDCLKRTFILIICFIFSITTLNIISNGRIIGRINHTIGEVNGLRENTKATSTIQNEEESNNKASNNSISASLNSRKEILKLHWRAFLDRPFIGTGPDTFNNRLVDDYLVEFMRKVITTGEGADKAHNEYLEYASSCGIFTLLSYLILLGFILKGLLKRKNEGNEYKIVFLVCIAYLIQAFFNMSLIGVAPLFWILLGYATQIIYKETSKVKE